MSRTIDAPTLAALIAATTRPVLLAEFDFAGGALRVWSGVGDLVVDGDTFSGIGTFGGISTVEEGADVSSRGLTFSLSGVPSALVSSILTDAYRNRGCSLWLGAFNDDRSALVGDPFLLFGGIMDTAELDDTGATAEIRIQAENRLVLLRRARIRRWTHEQQIQRYAGDLGLEYMSKLAERPIYWGIPTPPGSNSTGGTPPRMGNRMPE